MKRQIRKHVFETNSSSVHSLTMCTNEDFKKWENGEVLYWRENDEFATKEEIVEKMKKRTWYDGSLRYPDVDWNNENEISDIFSDEGIETYDEYFDDAWFETYVEEYTTPGNETIIAFGYYGHD